MRASFLFSFVLSAAVIGFGCNGDVDQTGAIPEACAAPPASAITTRSGEVWRLDVVQLGEGIGQAPATSASLGMNLDGLCSTSDESTHACARAPGGPRSNHADGDGGVDNAFGRVFVPMLQALEGRPSEAASGTSFLVFEGGGRATLHLGARGGQIIVSVPLTSVRLDEGRLDMLVELAAVIPAAELRDALVTRANDFTEPPSLELCRDSLLDGIATTVEQAQDLPLDLSTDRSMPCDGISIGLRFRATPVTESDLRKLPPTCAEQMSSDAGG